VKIVLASASPRRQALLAQLGLQFEIDSQASGSEEAPAGPDWRASARRLATLKARAAVPRHPGALIIAADTFGVRGRRPLVKPGSPPEAVRMLTVMSGRWHLVISGFALVDTATGRERAGAVETRVHFRRLTAQEISNYVATGEPMDKAGAYGIQGLGSALVDRIDGDYFNVVGLPLSALTVALREFGISVP
jgi:septum formation protein